MALESRVIDTLILIDEDLLQNVQAGLGVLLQVNQRDTLCLEHELIAINLHL